MSNAHRTPTPQQLAASTIAVFSHNLLNQVSGIALLAEFLDSTEGRLSDDERAATVDKLVERTHATIDLLRSGMLGMPSDMSPAVPAVPAVPKPVLS